MDILGWIVVILLAICFIILIVWLAESICIFFAKRKFKLFLDKADQDPPLKAVIDLIAAKDIKLIPSKLIFERRAFLEANPHLRCIAISNMAMKGFLNKKINLWVFLLMFTHELGHFHKTFEDHIKLIGERKRTCKIKSDCLYEELSATKIGIQILEEIADKKIEEKFISTLIGNILSQCRNCVIFFIKNRLNCPKLKELEEIAEISVEEKSLTVSRKISS